MITGSETLSSGDLANKIGMALKPSMLPPLDIIMVEDSMSDGLLTRFALDSTNIPYNLTTFISGNCLISNLLEQKQHNNLPDLIMLDLSLPGKTGFDILEELAKTPATIRSIPIIIMTNLPDFQYLQNSNNLFIAAYLNKPCDPQKLLSIMGDIR